MTKYDDADYHEGSAIEAGQPAGNAFTHIGLFLGWLIRHDLANPQFFSAADLAAVKAGTMSGSDLQSNVDGKLMSDMLTTEGAAFTDWYYEKYLDDYAAAFSDTDDYSIVDDVVSRSDIEPALDRRYSEWIDSGRSGQSGAEIPEYEFTPKYGPNDLLPNLEQMLSELQEISTKSGFSIEIESPLARSRVVQVTNIADMPRPHDAPDLERLIAPELGLELMSFAAKRWGDRKLIKALEELDISTAVANVASGISSAPAVRNRHHLWGPRRGSRQPRACVCVAHPSDAGPQFSHWRDGGSPGPRDRLDRGVAWCHLDRRLVDGRRSRGQLRRRQ